MYHCHRHIRFAAMFIDLMCTVNLKHFGQVCTQASELIAHTQWLLLRVFRCPTYGRRCWLLRNWNLDKQSKSKSGLHSSSADNWLCTASSKWKQSCPDRLVSRSSLRWCQGHKEALPATRNPERAGTEHRWLSKPGRDHGGSDDMEIMKKKTAAVVLLGWVWEVQAADPEGQDAAKAWGRGSQAAMEGGRTGDTGTTAAVSGSLRRWKVETQ